MKRFISATLAFCLISGLAHADMAIKVDETTQRYTIEENGKTVLTYNFGTVPVPDALKGKKYAEPRSNYVHPLCGPNGEVLTTDFSPDHPHHRGIYWAWPEVTYKGEMRDIHALQGVFARPVRIHQQSADKDTATISAENVWKWGDTEDIVRELTTITAYPRMDGIRPIDLSFTFEALRPGITLARRGRKAYGGFNFRMAQFTGVRIAKHNDAPGAFPRRSHAELTGTPPQGKETVGIFLMQNPANPLYPGDWVDFPNLPWLQPTFPSADMAFELNPGAPLKLAFRVVIRDGQGLAAPPERLFDDYAGKIPDPLLKMISYRFGENREILTGTEQALRAADAEGRKAIEQRILTLLETKETSVDFQSWAFRLMQSCGSEACLPVAAACLDKDSWMQALDAITAVPGDAATKILLRSLPALPDERKAAVIQALGMRQEAAAIPELAKYAAANSEITAGAALTALGRIGTSEAARILRSIKAAPSLSSQLTDAKIACANNLLCNAPAGTASPPSAEALGIYNEVRQDKSATDAQRAAALIGIVRCSKTATPEIIAALKSDNAAQLAGVAAALRLLDHDQLSALRQEFATLPDRSKLIIMALWGHRGIREPEPEILAQLKEKNEDLRLAAVKALRATGGRSAVAPLLAAVAAGGGTGQEAKITLTQLSGEGIFQALAAAARGDDAKIAAAAIEAIGDRRDPGYIDLMMTMAASADPKAANTALGTLRNCGTTRELPGLRKLLIEGDDAVKPGAASAIAGICAREADADLAALLNAAPEITGMSRVALIATLPALGGEAALAFVCRTRDEPAIRALLNWPDSSAVKPLQSIVADNALDDKLNKLASSALLMLVKKTVPLSAQGRELKAAISNVRDTAVKQQIADYAKDLNKVNLAKDKPVTASHPHQGGGKPELAVDGNNSTYWGCAHSPTSVTVDLGAEETISSIKVVNYYSDKRYYQYTVEVSTDGKTWNKVADMSNNTDMATEQGTTHKFEQTKARYVRVTMLKNSANPGMHIVELEVYGGGE